SLTNIPISSDSSVNARVVCRTNVTLAGVPYPAQVLTTINNNITTTYLDNTPDSSLTVYCPYLPTGFGNVNTTGIGGVFSVGGLSVAVGSNSGAGTGGGYANVSVGGNTLGDGNLQGGYRNAAFGVDALFACTTCIENTGLGTYGLTAVTTGTNNIGIGYIGGAGITTGSGNIAIGGGAMNNGGGATNNV